MPSAGHTHLRWKLDGEYPVPQFERLARTVSQHSTKNPRPSSRKSSISAEAKISPRQEIYKSMIREIRSDDVTQMNSLVHKASGILRLEHYKNLDKSQRRVIVSWDMDGRRVLNYVSKGGVSKTALQRETNLDRSSKRKLLASLNEPIFGLDFQHFKQVSNDYDTNDNDSSLNGSADCERRSTVSKVWEDYIDTGDVSKLWDDSKETIISRSKRRRNHSRSDSSIASESKSSVGSNSAAQLPWKSHIKPSRERIKSWQTNKTLWGTPQLVPADGTSNTNDKASNKNEVSNGDVKSKKSRSQSRHSHSRTSLRTEVEEPVDRVQHICVVNGSVVSFKDFGFENFTNWFGDESVLEANQQRAQPAFHLELDLSNVETKDIRIRLLDGYKLEIDAKRRIEGSQRRSLRKFSKKDFLHIPKGYRAEDLLLCRTKTGKLIVENLTPEPLDMKRYSKTRLSKQKSNDWSRPTERKERKSRSKRH